MRDQLLIDTDTLRRWLDERRSLIVLDVRPAADRAEADDPIALEAGANRCAVA